MKLMSYGLLGMLSFAAATTGSANENTVRVPVLECNFISQKGEEGARELETQVAYLFTDYQKEPLSSNPPIPLESYSNKIISKFGPIVQGYVLPLSDEKTTSVYIFEIRPVSVSDPEGEVEFIGQMDTQSQLGQEQSRYRYSSVTYTKEGAKISVHCEIRI
jgi:hypothetical protein